jgi:hypothetical protein
MFHIVKHTLSNAVIMPEAHIFISGKSVKSVKSTALPEVTEVPSIHEAVSIKNSWKPSSVTIGNPESFDVKSRLPRH